MHGNHVRTEPDACVNEKDEQETPADADKHARHESMRKIDPIRRKNKLQTRS